MSISTKNPMEFFRTLPPKQCSECGQNIHEQHESYLMECDHCLSKKDEYLRKVKIPSRLKLDNKIRKCNFQLYKTGYRKAENTHNIPGCDCSQVLTYPQGYPQFKKYLLLI